MWRSQSFDSVVMNCLVDLPELSSVVTAENVASRSSQRFFTEISAIDSLSCFFIFLLSRNSFVIFEPVDVLIHPDHKVGCDKEQ